MPLRRMLPFILINVVVSATVFLLLLYWWDSRDVNVNEVSATPGLQEGSPLATANLADFATPDDPGQAPADDAPQGAEDGAADDGEPDGPTTHTVQAGETLGVISQQYDVSIEDIATANNIVNVNALSVGQQLVIPIGGLATETPQPTPLPTETPAPTSSPTAEPEEDVTVVEITEVVGMGELTSEAVRITNVGTRPLPLQDWQLEDESGNVYTFGGVTLFGSSEAGAPSILIHTEAGQNGPSDLYWGLETAVWQPGETVTLRDALGTVQATYEIP